MAVFFWTLLSKFCLAVLSLRYHITVKGLEKLSAKELKKGGVLFLPNHPAHMDPLFLFLFLWPKYRMRPLVIEYIYRLPLLHPLMKLVKGVAIPSFDSSVNQLKIKKAQEAMQRIIDGLKRKENFAFYPAGKLKNSGKEVLGGASGAHALLQAYPEAHVVLVRTSGLWGSSFSRALLGRSPELPKTLLQGVKILLKNFIFFCPRRSVEIEVEPEPADLPRSGSRIEFNRYLENWYNRYPDEKGKISTVEPLKLVSYSFWREEFPQVFQLKKKQFLEGEVAISEEVRSKIYEEIRHILNNPGVEIAPSMNLALDLGMDSLNIAEMITYLTREYDVEELHPEDVETVENLLEIAEGARVAEHPVRQMGWAHWGEEKDRPSPVLPFGRTLPEAFLNCCERMRRFEACGDDLIGVLSYEKFKRAALVLATYFKKMNHSHIAVLLPASVGAYLVILGLELAGKVPVMLNWTLGPRYLDDMMKITGAKKAISSWRFLERLSHVEFGSVVDNIELLEDIRSSLKWSEKLRGALLSLCSASTLLRLLDLREIDENRPAVILFTSGTEANPKGVPLSHKNILANQRSAMQCIDFKATDVIYSILPPFHSFGFSVAGLFPLLAGLKTAFYPDPTDSFALAEGIERWKVTLFCSAPSFLKGLFHAAKEEELKAIRFFITGAEKTPPELYERVEKLGAGHQLIEGYGITECAPILSLNRPNLPPKGVGQILPDIEICTIHPETLELLPDGTEGEICVRGPNVFNGYLGNPRSPFIEIHGQRWYRTGDLGHLDVEGNLILSGRLKRFTKIGGEMISLGAVEEVLAEELLRRGEISTETPSLAICADEKVEGKPQLVLFTTISLDKEAANEILKNSGFSRLVKITFVKKIEEIPLMGTGKTDYRRLQTLI